MPYYLEDTQLQIYGQYFQGDIRIPTELALDSNSKLEDESKEPETSGGEQSEELSAWLMPLYPSIPEDDSEKPTAGAAELLRILQLELLHL